MKVVDERTRVRCEAGIGIIREEVWVDDRGKVVRYNYAFINHRLYSKDSGRVLGYDNAHGYSERHFKGTVKKSRFATQEELVERFFDEVEALRKEKGV